MNELHNSAYIDASNLHNGMKELGWTLDYKKFRVWLKDKYDVENSYIFLGYDPNNYSLYKRLYASGFILIFKETLSDSSGKLKGNCDAEMVLHIVDDYHLWKFNKAVIVTSDGDFACVAKYLHKNGAFYSLLSPRNRCSLLLKKLPISITYIDTQRSILETIPLK